MKNQRGPEGTKGDQRGRDGSRLAPDSVEVPLHSVNGLDPVGNPLYLRLLRWTPLTVFCIFESISWETYVVFMCVDLFYAFFVPKITKPVKLSENCKFF